MTNTERLSLTPVLPTYRIACRFLQAVDGFGTQGFAPPELWDDPHSVDASADVYSQGRVIAWVMTGKVPAPNRDLLPSQPGWAELVRDSEDAIRSMGEVLKRLEGLDPEKAGEPNTATAPVTAKLWLRRRSPSWRLKKFQRRKACWNHSRR